MDNETDQKRLSNDLQDFEIRLRNFIKNIINERFGDSFWDTAGEQQDPLIETKKKTKKIRKIEGEKHRKYGEEASDDLFDYLEFSDYKQIILTHWEVRQKKRVEKIFSKYFPKKETVVEYLDYLNLHRNAILGHVRGIITSQ